MDRTAPVIDEQHADDSNKSEIHQIFTELSAIRETLKSFAKGDFHVQITRRGAVWGYLKSLQANLQHLAWQVEQVAAGDFTQRVDFMGDFAAAFNRMIPQLEHSLEEMKDRETNERVQLMFDSTPLCCNLWNENYELVDCNLEAVKLYDLSSKQEYIEQFFNLVPQYQPNEQLSSQMLLEKLNEAFENGFVKYEFVHQKLDGEQIPAEITLVRVQQKDHFIIAGYTRDLRELKKTQSVLDQQRLLLIDILNTSPICFAILVDGTVRFESSFMKDFLGLDIDEHFIDYFADREIGINLLTNVQNDITVNWHPITLRSKEGEVKEMLANLFLTEYYGEQGIIVWLVDVTEIKRAEADLRAAKETAEHLGRIKDEFIANMSHELRTPMNAVFGIIHLIRSTELSDQQMSYIGTMETSAKQLLRIINDILDFSKLEAGKVIMNIDDFDVRQTVSEVLEDAKESADTKQLYLSHIVDDEVPPLVAGDLTRLRQILRNLISNAIKFTSAGSVQICVSVAKAESDRTVLQFAVQDTGIGMEQEEQKQIFIPFSQADTSATRMFGGTGLGLTICRSLVEMMGGEIWCQSEVNQGSIFFFTAVFRVPKNENEEIVFPDWLQGLPILLAEDNKINQIVATELLKKKGFHVDVVSNGLRAVEMVKQKNYGLVLMDIQMPEMDGIQATKMIRNDLRFAELPIVALTANAMEDDRKKCLAAGMNDHIAKPINPVHLYQGILKWARKIKKD
jgi:signal transduction histidine kinase